MRNARNFTAWFRRVEEQIAILTMGEMCYTDLPNNADLPQERFEYGDSPATAAREILKEAGYYDFGF